MNLESNDPISSVKESATPEDGGLSLKLIVLKKTESTKK